jgi:4-hydroxy-3-methylbut-2-enyl diphosphate reductase
LWVYHEIVHNKHVVDRFVQQGVTFVDDLEEVPEGQTVVFSAHGVSPEIRAIAKRRKLRVIDATCPLVTKVHVEVRRYARMGKRILLVGHRDHHEIKGTFGEAPEHMTVVESLEDVEALPFAVDTPMVYLTQTTLSVDDANVIIRAIKQKYPQCEAPPKDDICYATTNRQHAVRQLAPSAGLTLVVGSKNSSNSVRLTEISQNVGTPARLLDDATELHDDWFAGVDTVLLTAGASAPDDLVKGVIRSLQEKFGALVEASDVMQEDVHFALPVQLRILKHELSTGA